MYKYNYIYITIYNTTIDYTYVYMYIYIYRVDDIFDHTYDYVYMYHNYLHMYTPAYSVPCDLVIHSLHQFHLVWLKSYPEPRLTMTQSPRNGTFENERPPAGSKDRRYRTV